MTARGDRRGHPVFWENGDWHYVDGELADHDRPTKTLTMPTSSPVSIGLSLPSWGGGTILHEWTVRVKDILEALPSDD